MTPQHSHRRNPLSARAIVARPVPMLALAALCLWNSPAAADFRLCNNTSSRVGIALGYKDADGWTTEGWWNVSSRACETLLRGTLVARFYYIYALDYDRGGEWSGQAFMCSRDKEFTIRAPRIAWRAASTAPASLRSIPASSAPGPAADRVQRTACAAGAGNSRDGRPGRTGWTSGPAQFAGWHASGRVWPAASARIEEMRRLRRIKILATLALPLPTAR